MAVELSFKNLRSEQIIFISKCLVVTPVDKEAEKRKSWKNSRKIPQVKQTVPVLMFLHTLDQKGIYLPYRFACNLTGIRYNMDKQHLVTVTKDANGVHTPNFDAMLRDHQVPLVMKALGHLHTFGTTTMGTPPGSGKCLDPETLVLKYDGTLERVKNLKVDDLLMGDDSTPRRILSVCEGEDEMYEIIPKVGESWKCNKPHILTLKGITPWITGNNIIYSEKGIIRCVPDSITDLKEDIFDIPLEDYLKKDKDYKDHVYLFHQKVDFPQREVKFDPYMLGYLLLGRTLSKLDTPAEEIMLYLQKKQINEDMRFYFPIFKELGLFTKIHIPEIYKINSSEIRLQVLAGLLDRGTYKYGVYHIKTFNPNLSQDIQYLCHSLGFHIAVNKEDIYIYEDRDTPKIPTLIHSSWEEKEDFPYDPYLFGFMVSDSSNKNYTKSLKEKFAKYNIIFNERDGSLQNAEDFLRYVNSFKRLPQIHSYKNRLAFLEGVLIRATYKNETWMLTLSRDIIYDIAQISNSLGFKATCFAGDRLHICPYKPHICQSFKVIPLKQGKYAGFTLDGNGRFLLHDFTVTHNTIMASWLSYILGYLTLIYVHRDTIMRQWLTTYSKCIKGFEGRIWLVGEKEPPLTAIPAVIICMDGRFEQIPDNLMNLVGTLIIDEAHLFCTPTRVAPLLKPQPRYIIAESATLERDDEMHLMIQTIVGTHGIFMISEEPYDVIQYETHIFGDEESTRFGLNYDILLKSLAANADRNQMAINIVKANPTHKFMILMKLADHVKLLELLFKIAGIRVSTLYRNQKNYSDSQVLIGTMPKMGVGFDEENMCQDFQGVKSDTLILMSSVKKWQSYEQYRGRVMRSKKPIVIWFHDKNKTVRNHFKEMEEWIGKTHGRILLHDNLKNGILKLPDRE